MLRRPHRGDLAHLARHHTIASLGWIADRLLAHPHPGQVTEVLDRGAFQVRIAGQLLGAQPGKQIGRVHAASASCTEYILALAQMLCQRLGGLADPAAVHVLAQRARSGHQPFPYELVLLQRITNHAVVCVGQRQVAIGTKSSCARIGGLGVCTCDQGEIP